MQTIKTVIALGLGVLGAMSLSGCEEPGDSSDRRPLASESAQVALLVENDDSPVDILQANEARNVTFGSHEGGLLLDASEVSDSRPGGHMVASGSGDELLIATETYRVRYRDDDGDGDGDLEILDADEVVLVRQPDTILQGAEVPISRLPPETLNESIILAAEEVKNGRWSSLVEEAVLLASDVYDPREFEREAVEFLDAVAVDLDVLDATVRSADRDALLEGDEVSRTLYRVPEDNEEFATGFSYDELLVADEYDPVSSFFWNVGNELLDVIEGEEVRRTYLPQILLDADGYPIDLDHPKNNVRFRLSWSERVDLDLHVVTPAGAEIFYQNRFEAGGVLDVDNTQGGPGAYENVVFSEAEAGEYVAYVEFLFGEKPADFVLTAYVAGHAVDELRGTLDPPTDGTATASQRLKVQVAARGPQTDR